MNFDLSDDQLAIRDAVDAICADFGADYWLVLLHGLNPERILVAAAALGAAEPKSY